jgi:hypothetical protein
LYLGGCRQVYEVCTFYDASTPYIAMLVAKVFFDHVYKLHGLPSAIVLDCDKVFTSRFWKELFALADVQLCMSTTYHPQLDGQSERVNQCLETYLCCFMSSCPRKWSS